MHVDHGFVVGTGADGVAQSEEAGQAQHQRWFAHRFAVEGRGLDVVVIKQGDVEVLGHIACHWNFVGAGAMREQFAFFVPNAFFHGEPTHALHIRTFDLTFVDGGVDALACVVHDVHRFEPPLARAGVDFDFAHSSAVAVVIKRTTVQCGEVLFDFGRHVKTGDAQTHAIEPRLFGQVGPVD